MMWPWTRRRKAVEDELLAILIMNPYGIQAVELAETAGYPLHRVRRALRRMVGTGQVMPLELETNVRVWMVVMPEDGDQ